MSSSGLPSISLEDILPMAESFSSTAAPNEVQEKKRGREAALMSEAELTSEDRKRRRQASKSVRRKQRHAEESDEKAAAQAGNSSKRYETKKLDEALRADKRVVESAREDPDQATYSKSAAFFAQLQRQAQDEIGGKGASRRERPSLKPAAGSFSKL